MKDHGQEFDMICIAGLSLVCDVLIQSLGWGYVNSIIDVRLERVEAGSSIGFVHVLGYSGVGSTGSGSGLVNPWIEAVYFRVEGVAIGFFLKARVV
ncbi:hypothetical protein L1987_46681 [Smallanthus sonchifolius]|uniref:Uncharacterized protein n=1 Tax=Smallanthus sonchifolius TaxID=185202 RepID=A0ACB9G1I1_9ASTR|nr:hypothetical protein L1987_46681 [Smallanthus sonchifolius]